MDTLFHAACGAVLMRAATTALGLPPEPALEAGSALVGALPDLAGFAEKVFTKNANAWRWYNWFHRSLLHEAPKALRTLVHALMLLPPYGLHVMLDAPLHEAYMRWWVFDEALWAEVLAWVLLVIVALSLY